MKNKDETFREFIDKEIKDVHYPKKEDFNFMDYYIEQLCLWYRHLSHSTLKQSKLEHLKLRKEILDSIYKFYKDN